MKKWMPLLLMVVMVNCNDNNQAETPHLLTDLFILNIKGHVKEVIDSLFIVAPSGKLMRDALMEEHTTYQDGYVNSYVATDTAGNKLRSFTTRYKNGHWKELYNIRNGRLVDSTFIKLEPGGKIIEGLHFDSARRIISRYTELEENEYRQIVKGKQYDGNGRFVEAFTQSFEQQHPTGYIITDSTGQVSSIQTIMLNNQGEPQKQTLITMPDSIITVKTYRYERIDPVGNWAERREYDGAGRLTRFIKRKIVYDARK